MDPSNELDEYRICSKCNKTIPFTEYLEFDNICEECNEKEKLILNYKNQQTSMHTKTQMKQNRNYIHNTLGISKDEIRTLIREELNTIIKEQITKVLNDENRLRKIIKEELLREIKSYNHSEGRNSYLVCTIQELYHQIDKVIHEEVLKRLQITLKEVNPNETD